MCALVGEGVGITTAPALKDIYHQASVPGYSAFFHLTAHGDQLRESVAYLVPEC